MPYFTERVKSVWSKEVIKIGGQIFVNPSGIFIVYFGLNASVKTNGWSIF